ncbi:hypothetical protein BC936DRAFT_138085 [Jimgerdemannia flammicorona]|uniref:Uncharacterized protein n=1 Tax=Jimgerdemannia flammicorona TaxID=994334 RepID=A0A433CVY6_9FUNG|nr:hypothetical protein BC936DRAFT_138085 [Jimgerdemannia flammicorona]
MTTTAERGEIHDDNRRGGRIKLTRVKVVNYKILLYSEVDFEEDERPKRKSMYCIVDNMSARVERNAERKTVEEVPSVLRGGLEEVEPTGGKKHAGRKAKEEVGPLHFEELEEGEMARGQSKYFMVDNINVHAERKAKEEVGPAFREVETREKRRRGSHSALQRGAG